MASTEKGRFFAMITRENGRFLAMTSIEKSKEYSKYRDIEKGIILKMCSIE